MNSELLDFKTLYDKYSPLVRSFLYRMVGVNLLNDAVQECFLRVWKYRSSFKNQSSVKTWIFSIARNTAVDLLKKNPLPLEFNHEVKSEELTEKSDLQIDLSELVLLLPMEYREVIVSVLFEELTLAETSKVLSIPEGTVKSRLFRGKELLKDHLQKRGYDE